MRRSRRCDADSLFCLVASAILICLSPCPICVISTLWVLRISQSGSGIPNSTSGMAVILIRLLKHLLGGSVAPFTSPSCRRHCGSRLSQ